LIPASRTPGLNAGKPMDLLSTGLLPDPINKYPIASLPLRG